MQINAAPYTYKNDPRMLVTWTIAAKDSPTGKRLREKRVAPAGLDKVGALAWGDTLKREVWTRLMGETRVKEDTHTPIAPKNTPKSGCPTLRDFWTRFESEYVNLQKPATQKGYRCAWVHYFGPVLGDHPLDCIDRAAVAKLRTALGRLQPASRNQVLYKLRSVLDQAVTWGILEEVPQIKPDREPKKPEPVTYSESQAEALIAAARMEGREHTAIVLLLLHAGLRVSEVCALRWRDIDFARGLMMIQHNLSAGVDASPKGGIAAPVGLSPDLAEALQALPRQGDHVLMRRPMTRANRGTWCPHNPQSVTFVLNQVQRAAGLEETGPHKLRHSCLTLLASKGLDPWKLQAHARHARISTTQRYVHLAKEQAALDAAAMWAKPQASPKRPKSARNPLQVAA